MKWNKLGHIYNSNYHHEEFGDLIAAMVPAPRHMGGDEFIIYYGARDSLLRSRVFQLNFNIKTLQVTSEPTLALGLGKLGTFDDSGLTFGSFVQVEDTLRLYYGGINVLRDVPFTSDSGLATIHKDGTIERVFDGPILSRTALEPYFSTMPFVLFDKGIFRVWYVSAVRWVAQEEKPKHYYHIKYAESADGIKWDQKGTVAIDFKNEYEYAFARPCVLKDEDCYRMWYSYRAGPDAATYRIGHAESPDGVTWTRKDESVGIDVSESGWDSEMLCYPYVFDHDGKRYMLYNGNGYGRTGFGIAVLEEE